MNEDLKRISKWENEWKISLNFDPTKQAQEVSVGKQQKQTILPYFLITLRFLKFQFRNISVYYSILV